MLSPLSVCLTVFRGTRSVNATDQGAYRRFRGGDAKNGLRDCPGGFQ